MIAAHSDAAINQDARGSDFDDCAARADFVTATEERDVHLLPSICLEVASHDQIPQRCIDRLGVRKYGGDTRLSSVRIAENIAQRIIREYAGLFKRNAVFA